MRNRCSANRVSSAAVPKVVDHAQRRHDLVEATAQVIAAEGLRAATVRRIARQVGCTTGLVTHYFPGKDDLMIGALRLVHESAAERMNARSRQAAGLNALRAVLLESLPLTPAGEQEWRVWLAFWGVAWTSPALAEEYRARYGLWRRAIRHLLGEAARLGETRPGLDLGQAADRVVALIDGLGLQACYEPGVLTPDRVVALVDAELAGLAASAQPPPRP
jgi:AcrR family transcriptional regulator